MITFGRTIPNTGYETRYRREMRVMIKAMHKDTLKELKVLYSVKIFDAPITLTQIMANLRLKWYKFFEKRAREMSRWLVETVGKRTKKSIMQQLKKIGFAIEPHYSADQQKNISKLVEESVGLIKSIPQKYLRNVQETVNEAVLKGGDMNFIKEQIQDKINTEAFPNAERRAELIAKDQVNKVTQNLAIQEAQAVGATKAEWIHVPGEFSSRITHIHMDGQEYDLNVGMWDEDVQEYVKPGQLPYCMCQSAFIFPTGE